MEICPWPGFVDERWGDPPPLFVLRLMAEHRFRSEDLLSPAVAADVAGCSVRTIRRAYLSGSLVAYRDAHGRSVRVSYGDLRSWMMSGLACSPALSEVELKRVEYGEAKRSSSKRSENLALLLEARKRRGPGIGLRS